MQDTKDKPILAEDALFNLLRALLAKKRLIVRNTAIGVCVGVLFALGVQKTWTSEIMLAPEINSESSLSGSVGSLASMVGINLGNMTSDAIYPELYPQIISSKPFITGLFSVPVSTLDGEISTSLYDYLKNNQSYAWWEYPGKWLKGGMNKLFRMFKDDPFGKKKGEGIDPFYLSRDQDEIYQILNNAVISSDVNKKDQVITLSVTTQDPLISATLVDTVRVRLQAAITDYRTRKARYDMEYAERLMNEARADYKYWQQKYSVFSDSHFNSVLSSVSSEQDELENQMSLAYTVYSQMVQQYYAARARVQERTPSFTTIQPASVALKPSSMPKLAVVFLWGFLFFSCTVIWILCIDTYRDWKSKLMA